MLDLGKRDGFITKDVDHYAGHLEIGQGEKLLGILSQRIYLIFGTDEENNWQGVTYYFKKRDHAWFRHRPRWCLTYDLCREIKKLWNPLEIHLDSLDQLPQKRNKKEPLGSFHFKSQTNHLGSQP